MSKLLSTTAAADPRRNTMHPMPLVLQDAEVMNITMQPQGENIFNKTINEDGVASEIR